MIDPAELIRDVQLPSGDLLIGDRWEADTSGGRREQINPSTGEALASVAMGGSGRGGPGDRLPPSPHSPSGRSGRRRGGATCLPSWLASSMPTTCTSA